MRFSPPAPPFFSACVDTELTRIKRGPGPQDYPYIFLNFLRNLVEPRGIEPLTSAVRLLSPTPSFW